jgi:hypothetical protein
MTVSVALVCEAPDDRLAAMTIVNRVICQAAHWHDPAYPDDFIWWRGYRKSDGFLKWSDVTALAKDLAISVTGRVAGELPRHPFAKYALKAMRVLATSPDPFDAVVLVHDSDDELERLDGFRQARDHVATALTVALGMPHTKRECWVIAGFDPDGTNESERLAAIHQRLGYDPREQSERLTAGALKGKHNAKLVLEELTCGLAERELCCIRETSLVTLRARGTGNYLKEFTEEVQKHLVPLFAPTSGGQ